MSRYFERLASRSELSAPIGAHAVPAPPSAAELRPMPLEQETEVYAPAPPLIAPPAQRASVRSKTPQPDAQSHPPTSPGQDVPGTAPAPEEAPLAPPRPAALSAQDLRTAIQNRMAPRPSRDDVREQPERTVPVGEERAHKPQTHTPAVPQMPPVPASPTREPAPQPQEAPAVTHDQAGQPAAVTRPSVVSRFRPPEQPRAETRQPETSSLIEAPRPSRKGGAARTETRPIEIHIGSIALEVRPPAPALAPAGAPAPPHSESAPRRRFSPHRHYLRWG